MYTLGDYNQALAHLASDDGARAITVRLVRTPSRRLVVSIGREGPELFGLLLEDDGRLRVLTWDADGVVSGSLEVGVQP